MAIGGPILLNWFIHGNYERYLWIINGPYPFSHMGSGPFQLAMYAQLVLVGLALFALGVVLELFLRKKN
ncbi:MAG: hypothetical protein HY340_00900 [Candidatus Kerfeldbacteria bacterium]|nr:hypothetical protein [Candidatus Kerfeldbacteria bacterium]